MNPDDHSVGKNGIGPPRLAAAVILRPGDPGFPEDAGREPPDSRFRDCAHPGCETRFHPHNFPSPYCMTHRGSVWDHWRAKHYADEKQRGTTMPKSRTAITAAQQAAPLAPVACHHPGCTDTFTGARRGTLYCPLHREDRFVTWRSEQRRRDGSMSPMKAAQTASAKSAAPLLKLTCAHGGCAKAFKPSRRDQRFCPEHGQLLWARRRSREKKRIAELAESAPGPSGLCVPPAAALPPTTTIATARELGKKSFRDLRVGKGPSALDVQAGGDHYKIMAIQPIEYAEANKLSACEFAIVKYVSRHRVKGGRLDLQKLRHCVDLLEELTYGPPSEDDAA